jgi:hypothetical protein
MAMNAYRNRIVDLAVPRRVAWSPSVSVHPAGGNR